MAYAGYFFIHFQLRSLMTLPLRHAYQPDPKPPCRGHFISRTTIRRRQGRYHTILHRHDRISQIVNASTRAPHLEILHIPRAYHINGLLTTTNSSANIHIKAIYSRIPSYLTFMASSFQTPLIPIQYFAMLFGFVAWAVLYARMPRSGKLMIHMSFC